MSWLTVALVALWVGGVVQTLFVCTYATVTPWRSDYVGRALFYKSITLAALLDNSLLAYYWHYQYAQQVGVVLICAVSASIVYQYQALLRRLFGGAVRRFLNR